MTAGAPRPVTAQQPAMLTLADAIRRAEQVQTGVVQAQAAVQTAQAARRAAFGAWLPSLSASGSSRLTAPRVS
jgi:outer membrane protein TolC